MTYSVRSLIFAPAPRNRLTRAPVRRNRTGKHAPASSADHGRGKRRPVYLCLLIFSLQAARHLGMHCRPADCIAYAARSGTTIGATPLFATAAASCRRRRFVRTTRAGSGGYQTLLPQLTNNSASRQLELPSHSRVAAQEKCHETLCLFDRGFKLDVGVRLRDYASRLLSSPASPLLASRLPYCLLLEPVSRCLAWAR
jgi:hypothetical protein